MIDAMRFLWLLLLTFPLAAAPQKYIVQFREAPLAVRKGVSAAEYEQTFARFRSDLRGHGVVAAAGESPVAHEYYRVFHGAAVALDDAEVARVRALPYVAAVHVDGEVEAYDDAVSGSMPRAAMTRPTSGGDGIVVAVIDTGIDASHPALAGKVAGGWDFVNDDDDPHDDHRHGTHVAGIIAASGGEMTGVAPDVSLIAYKVLGADGRGATSLAVAAFERAVDPNRDGDLSDRVDVANVSLGSFGHAGDPVAQAANNAVAAGVIVVVAAGNAEMAHAIGSPAGAENVITVGAVDATTAVAAFSSRGPAAGTNVLKPDVMAPGVSILSTVPGGGYLRLNGTSMATPYVSGIVALLIADHPDWTPARVKSALVSSALPIAGEHVMTQGGGNVAHPRAADSVIAFQPAQVAFGLDASTASSWTGHADVTVRNEGATPQILTIAAPSPGAGITIAALPAELTLAPGESAAITFSILVDHPLLGEVPPDTMSFGGHINIATTDMTLRLPWGFIRGARALITYADAPATLFFDADPATRGTYVPTGPSGGELLVEPGTYGFVLITAGDEPRVIIREQQAITGDSRYALAAADAPHALRLETFPAAERDDQLASVVMRLMSERIDIPFSATAKTIHASSFSDAYTLLVAEAFVDGAARFVGLAQHPLIHGLSSGRSLRMAESDMRSQEVRFEMPTPAPPRNVRVMPRQWRRNAPFGPQPPSVAIKGTGPLTLAFSPEVDDDSIAGVQLALTRADGEEMLPALTTPIIRRRGDTFLSVRSIALPPLPGEVVAGETLTYGDGPAHMPSVVRADENGVAGSFLPNGTRGELLAHATARMRYRFLDGDTGAQLAAGVFQNYQTHLPFARRGKTRLEIRSDDMLVAGRQASGTLTLSYDTRAGVANPPAITSLAILDAAGRHTSRLPLLGNGTLVFSIADTDANGVYRRIAGGSTGVFFRQSGKSTWIQLTPVEVAEEGSEITERAPVGVVYRVDLANALQFEGGIELAISAADENGATTSWHLAPAFVSERGPLIRRRAVR